MPATAPVLAGSTLAHPTRYRETVAYRGKGVEMADGSVNFDLVNANAKRQFQLEWDTLTSAQKSTLQTAFAAVKNSSGAYTAPDAGTYTVTRDQDRPDLEFEFFIVAGGNFRFRARLVLREV